MLLRISTINNLLSKNSFLSNVFHISLDLSAYPELKIIMVMTIVYLPFMIFPIYTVLEKSTVPIRKRPMIWEPVT